MDDVDPNDQTMFIRIMVAGATLYNTVMLACKLSILLLYRRLFPIEDFNKRWWCITIFTISYSLVIAIASAFGWTLVNTKWHAHETGDKSPAKWAFYVANTAFNLISDILILILPIPIIWNLSLEFRQKITICILFSLGSATIIVSAVRLQSVILYAMDDDGDVTYQSSKLAIWSTHTKFQTTNSLVETTVSIVCVCAPTLRPFFRRHFGSFFSWSSRYGTGSGFNLSGDGPHRYPHTTNNGDIESNNRSSQFITYHSFLRSTRSHSRHMTQSSISSPHHPHHHHHHHGSSSSPVMGQSLELGNSASGQKVEPQVIEVIVDHRAGSDSGGETASMPPSAGYVEDDARSTDRIISDVGGIGYAQGVSSRSVVEATRASSADMVRPGRDDDDDDDDGRHLSSGGHGRAPARNTMSDFDFGIRVETTYEVRHEPK
ncbi:hypothetical protein BFW01_g2163 [Lasiodiplodia theobromae]|nr:hypothetical protein BFW01_g2163 [Lasiodiplodia theobromae]